MNEADDSLNKFIEDNLRKAHQQVQLRPEWAAQVLNQISAELEQGRNADGQLVTRQPVIPSTKRSWPKVTVATGLAAGLLLAVLGSVFLARLINHSRPNDAAKSVANNLPSRHPKDTLPQDASPSNNAPTEPQLAKSEELPIDSVTEESVTDDSVTAGTGYLATKLSSEAEFEIYVVLPTMPINVAGNTK